MAFEIRTITDESEIDVLHGQVSSFGNFEYAYDEDTITLLKRNFRRELSRYLIACEDTVFAGFCSIDTEWWEDDFAFLREIFIHPSAQGVGLGEELMRQCLAHAQSEGLRGVVTETAFENARMRRLCEKLGFREWDNPEWKDGVTFKLIFDSAEKK